MTLLLELPAEVEARLTAEAQERNQSLHDYALNKLVALPAIEPDHEETAGEGILRLMRQMREEVGEEVWNSLPPDFSINHDHYIHGAPKVVE